MELWAEVRTRRERDTEGAGKWGGSTVILECGRVDLIKRPVRPKKKKKIPEWGTSLVVQWLRLCAFNAEGRGFNSWSSK